MPRIELTIDSDLFDQRQDASIRENLPVRTLLTEIRREFNLPDDAVYSLRVQATGRVLDAERTLEQQSVASGAILVLQRERRAAVREAVIGAGAARNPLSGPLRPYLIEESTNTLFEIAFQPALIGRPDPTNPESEELLAINLGPYDTAKSVSRYHARITEDDGEFFLESLADHNPAYLNDSIVRVGDKRRLVQGDKIKCGKISMAFTVRVQTTSSPRPAVN
jgi:uncharacterized ubiquitin-like protein YukD